MRGSKRVVFTEIRCALRAVTSSRRASGLRWLSLMLLPEIPWAGRCWALPFLTVLVSMAARIRQNRRAKIPHFTTLSLGHIRAAA
jgi:hypothetical protein